MDHSASCATPSPERNPVPLSILACAGFCLRSSKAGVNGMHPEPLRAALIHNRVSRHAGNPYDLIPAISEDATRSPATYNGLVAVEPYPVTADMWSRRVSRYPIIKSWQGTSLELLASSIRGDAHPCIAAALLDELPHHVGWMHHRRTVQVCAWTPR